MYASAYRLGSPMASQATGAQQISEAVIQLGEAAQQTVETLRQSGLAIEQLNEIARGLANYGSGEARLIARKSSTEFERMLGYIAEPEMIHRDNLVLTRG